MYLLYQFTTFGAKDQISSYLFVLLLYVVYKHVRGRSPLNHLQEFKEGRKKFTIVIGQLPSCASAKYLQVLLNSLSTRFCPSGGSQSFSLLSANSTCTVLFVFVLWMCKVESWFLYQLYYQMLLKLNYFFCRLFGNFVERVLIPDVRKVSQ